MPLADYPPHFWMEKQDQWLICATPFAQKQAIHLGLPKDQIFVTTGLLIPRHDLEQPTDRRITKAHIGLRPDLPVALVQAGAEGSQVMPTLGALVKKSDIPCQFLFMTGQCHIAYETLSNGSDDRIRALRFTEDFASYVRLADYVIGKPGSVTVSQAAALGKPMLVCAGRSTLPQERYNVEWVVQNGFGKSVPRWRDMMVGLEPLLERVALDRLHDNLQRYRNQAFSEVPQILERVMSAK